MHDARISRALTKYVRRATGRSAGHISIDYGGGTATIVGAAESPTQAAAISDLVRWHDGVRRVVNHLRVEVRG